MTSLQTQGCPGHVNLSQIKKTHQTPRSIFLKPLSLLPQLLLSFNKKWQETLSCYIIDFSILVFPSLDFSPNYCHPLSPSDVEVCSRAWCICFRGDSRWWLGHRPWLCGEFGNSFAWIMKSRGEAFGPFCNLSGGLEEGQSGAEIDPTVKLTSRAVGCNEWSMHNIWCWEWKKTGEETGVWLCDWWVITGYAKGAG